MVGSSPNSKIQLLAIWSGIIYVVIIFIGLWPIAGFFPPHSPSLSADEINRIYLDDTTNIRVGLIIYMLSSPFYIPFTAALAHYINRIEGHVGILTISQIAAGTINALLTIFVGAIWLVATYRPELSADVRQMLNDMGWFVFLGLVPIYYPVVISVALASFIDKNAAPVFPRWVGYFSLSFVLISLPALFIWFFKSGPFAWDGLIALWIPLIELFLWYAIVTYFMTKALKSDK